MPNHVINEVIFRDLAPARSGKLLAKAMRGDQTVDFSILLPLPLHMFPGNVSSNVERRFPGTWLDAGRDIWGTKWNAYGQDGGAATQEGRDFTLRFRTAWSPPMGWLNALALTMEVPFEHNWLSEGDSDTAYHAVFDYSDLSDWRKEPWKEVEADEPLRRHLHKLLWGVEVFADDE